MKKLLGFLLLLFLSISLFSVCYLTNGTMESWNDNGAGGPPDDWTIDNTTSFSASQEGTIVYDGSYSTNLTWTDQGNRNLYQEISVTGGNDYEFCSYIYDNDTAARIQLYINWYNSSDTYISSSYSDYSTDTAGWQYLRTGTKTAPSTAVKANIYLRGKTLTAYWDGDATIYVDDATFCDNTCPLSVELSNFYADFNNDELTLHWKTYSETNNQGWNVYRSDVLDLNTAEKVNLSLIPGNGTTTEMSKYVYKDETSVDNHKTYYYWIESVENSGNTEFYNPISININNENNDTPIPDIPFAVLSQNYPNPFNPNTTIEFDVQEGSQVTLDIYNLNGEKIRTLYSGLSKGHNVVNWDGANNSGNKVSSGIYLYRLIYDNNKIMKKMVLLK